MAFIQYCADCGMNSVHGIQERVLGSQDLQVVISCQLCLTETGADPL